MPIGYLIGWAAVARWSMAMSGRSVAAVRSGLIRP